MVNCNLKKNKHKQICKSAWKKSKEKDTWINRRTKEVLRVRPNNWKEGGYDVILSDNAMTLHGYRLKNYGSKSRAENYIKKYIR